MLATAPNPPVGYGKAARIVLTAGREQISLREAAEWRAGGREE